MILDRIVNAQRGKIRRMVQTVNVLRRLASATRVCADRRVHYKHLDIPVVEMPAIEIAPRKIYDADTVGLTDRPQSAFPHPDPMTAADKLELRALCPN
jgi:hypothetical protein